MSDTDSGPSEKLCPTDSANTDTPSSVVTMSVFARDDGADEP